MTPRPGWSRTVETDLETETGSESEREPLDREAVGPVVYVDEEAQEVAADPGEPADLADPGGPADPADAAEVEEPRKASAWRTRFALLTTAACLLLALTGGVLLHRAHQLRSTPAADNHALTDVEATTRVNGDISSALAKIFSYAPGGTAATERSAREVLTGRAADQYAQLFAQVRENVTRQKVTLISQTVRVGTIRLDGDSATLLVFLDQTARRGDARPTTSAAQLTVSAALSDDTWRITEIKAR